MNITVNITLLCLCLCLCVCLSSFTMLSLAALAPLAYYTFHSVGSRDLKYNLNNPFMKALLCKGYCTYMVNPAVCFNPISDVIL